MVIKMQFIASFLLIKCYNNYGDYMSYKDYFVIDNIAANPTYLRIILDEIVNVYEQCGAKFDFKWKIIRTWVGLNPQFLPSHNENLCDEIHLAINDSRYWCLVVYQLSHELHHLFAYIHASRSNYVIRWVEELVCEAISYYFLKYFSDNYFNSNLYKYDNNYGHYFTEYINSIAFNSGNGKLKSLRGYQELLKFEETVYTNRENHHNEVYELFTLIDQNSLIPLLNVKNYYYVNRHLIITSALLKDYGHIPAIRYICDLQNNIIR